MEILYNGQVNLTTLYNKVPYFKKLNQGNGRGRRGRNTVRNKKEKEESDGKEKKKFGFLKHATRFALGVNNISVNYSENKGKRKEANLNLWHLGDYA